MHLKVFLKKKHWAGFFKNPGFFQPCLQEKKGKGKKGEEGDEGEEAGGRGGLRRRRSQEEPEQDEAKVSSYFFFKACKVFLINLKHFNVITIL
jgi:hypothetical protein